MMRAPTFEDIFATMSAASVGDASARVPLPDELRLEDLATRLAIAVNLLLDDLAMRSAELVELEAARQESARLKELNDFQSNLLNVASHELNTPIGALKLQLFLLRQAMAKDSPPRVLEGMALLERNVARLAGLVDQTLDVGRLQSGKLAIRPAGVRLQAILDEVLATYRPVAAEAHIDLCLAPGEAPLVWADADRLTQVLNNLVSNGLKFTPSGGRVEIMVLPDEREIAVEVVDTGLGMDAAQMGRLFQPFSQVHDVRSAKFRGTGLGLYISKGIIEQHGGRLWAESAGKGAGSTFRFTLPRAPSAESAGERAGLPSA